MRYESIRNVYIPSRRNSENIRILLGLFFSPLGLVISDLISPNEKKNELIYSPTTCDMQCQTKFISSKNNEMKMD